MPADTRQSLTVPAIALALFALIFAMDAVTPLGYAEWIFYNVPIALALLQSRPALPLVLAALGTVLAVIGYFLSPEGATPVVAITNRAIGLATLWPLALLIHRMLLTRARLHDLLWLQQSESTVGQALLGELTPTEVGERASAALAQVLGAQVGVTYRFDGQVLVESGTYGVDRNGLTLRFARGEGLPGQVAATKEPRVVGDVPDGHAGITSGTVRVAPRSLLLAPYSADQQLLGVIELGFADRRDDFTRDLTLAKAVGDQVGLAMRAALYRQGLVELLEETQRQSEELQTQQEELRVTNEELEQQSRVLAESQSRLELQQVELEQSNAQLEERTNALERQKAALLAAQAVSEATAVKLEAASRYKSEFLANMSHELRTPLNSALILSKLLASNKAGNLSDEQVRYAEAIHASNNDLLVLINDILDLSKIEAGHVELNLAEVPLADTLERLRTMFEPLAAQKSLSFRIEPDGDVPAAITSDVVRVQQVLKNLLANAIKFTERGEVRLRVRRDGTDGVAFDVHDTGVGIPRSQQDVVFEAFRQADGSTSRRFGGTGLGLSISRQLARRLGGDVTLDSEPGRGSVFTLALPIHLSEAAAKSHATPAPLMSSEPEDGAAAARQIVDHRRARTADTAKAATPAAAPEPEPERRFPGRLVLAIEDDPHFARVVVDLAADLSFDCVVATSGSEALELARRLKPNGILLDIGLPDQSGLGVLERLKRDPTTRHIPVHVVSTHERTQTALELGAIGYLQKPTDREHLAEAFSQLESRLQQKLRRLLIVEDDEKLRANLKLLLDGEHTEIETVGTIAAALDALAHGSFDCMVMDLALPDGSGYELLERLAGGSQPFPPVIVYTGRALSRDEEQRLRRYSRSIIVKGARSPERLLDEVTLFLHSVESTLPPTQQSLLQKARQRDAVLDGRQILVAEDDARNIFAVTSVLEPLGARLTIARNGREAVERLAGRTDVDLVLMDIMMPEMDGLEAMRRIRALPDHANLPIIALTAKAMPDDRERCLEAGANDYIAKPLDVDKLVSLCRVWMPK